MSAIAAIGGKLVSKIFERKYINTDMPELIEPEEVDNTSVYVILIIFVLLGGTAIYFIKFKK